MILKYIEAKLFQNDTYTGQCHEKKLNAQLIALFQITSSLSLLVSRCCLVWGFYI